MLLLCLSGKIYAQIPMLETKVSLQYKQIEIGNILKDLNKRYKLKFSYSNNIVPEQKKVSINIKNVMLKDALHDLFYETGVGFQVVGEQIVLKKDARKNTPSAKEYRAATPEVPVPVLYEPKVDPEELIVSNNEDFIVDTITEGVTLKVPLLVKDDYTPSKRDLRRRYKGERKMLKARFYILKDSLRRKGTYTLDKLDMKYNYVSQKMKQRFDRLRNSEKNKMLPKDSLQKTVSQDSSTAEQIDNYIYRPIQITFVSPLGTNGVESGRCVNGISFNVLGGYSAGLAGVELGGIANVEKDFVKGVQLAGVINTVMKKTEGIQLSGFANVCGDTVRGLQAAGFINTINGSIDGFQGAGFLNANRGSVQGFQGAGFINIAQDSVIGMQVAGFANINNGNVDGIQAAGFLNTAKKVNGMQIGILNIADTVSSGIPIGFLSIVRKGGYRRFEISASEALYANVAYKIGVRSFYNIFQTGAQLKDNKVRVGMGYGIGSEIALGKRAMVNIENITSNVWEPMMTVPQLNLMHRFSPTFGIRVGNKTTLFAGPSLNGMLSRYKNPGATEPGSDLPPYSVYDHTFNPTAFNTVNLKLWFGFNAGIRF